MEWPDRVLKPGGLFVTQQIGFSTKISINSLLGGPAPAYELIGWGEIVAQFEQADFNILERQEFIGRDVFDDIGAVALVLTAAPWEIPGFSVEHYRHGLKE